METETKTTTVIASKSACFTCAEHKGDVYNESTAHCWKFY